MVLYAVAQAEPRLLLSEPPSAVGLSIQAMEIAECKKLPQWV